MAACFCASILAPALLTLNLQLAVQNVPTCQDVLISLSLPQGLCPFHLENFLHPSYRHPLLPWSAAPMKDPTTCLCLITQFPLVSLVTVDLMKSPSQTQPVCPVIGI